MIGNLKKSISLREKIEKEHLKKPGLLFKSAHDLKLALEFLVIAFVLVPGWLQNGFSDGTIMKLVTGLIVFVGFFENFINIHVELFKASIDTSKFVQ